MTRSLSVEDLVLGHVLDDRRRGRGGGDGSSSRLGTRKERQTRALLRNAGAPRGWQSVVKRIVGGSARTPQELKRLLDYVAREEGVQSTWCNLAGYERDFDLARTVALPLMKRQNAFVALLSQNLAHNYETTELTK